MEYGPELAANASDAKITKASIKRAANGNLGEIMAKIKARGGIVQGKPKITEVK